MDTWRRVWEERGRSYPGENLTALNGFDQPFSKLTPHAVAQISKFLVEELAPNSSDYLLEVGCGVGLLIGRMAGSARIIGHDLAAAMLVRAKALWPTVPFVRAEAQVLPFRSGLFQGAFAHSVFQYFPDCEYARRTLSEMYRVVCPGGRLLIAGVLDVELKDAYLLARNEASANEIPIWRSSIEGELNHLYYSRDFFRLWAARHHCDIRFGVRTVPGNLSSRFQFDVLVNR